MEPSAAPGAVIDELGIEGAAPPEAGGDDQDALSNEDGLRAKQDRLLVQLAKIWKANEEHELGDLKTWYTTGLLLNRELGPPNKRLPHGEETLKLVGERCQVSELELSRMRWFAHLVPDFDDLRGMLAQLESEEIRSETSVVRSWTRLKALLPDLKALMDFKSGNSRKPAARRTRPAWGKVLKLLDRAKAELAQVDSAADGEPGEQLLAELRELSELMSSRFQITISNDRAETAIPHAATWRACPCYPGGFAIRRPPSGPGGASRRPRWRGSDDSVYRITHSHNMG